MSVGSIQFQDFEIIKKAVQKTNVAGKIIIATCHNKNVFTGPACIPNVISVVKDDNLNENEILFNSYDDN